ncbi:NeuD/PglB/VioB family sugar acetyltransferase [Roseovarius litoreus]|nr:NeuD/PglB/VioB family sugar acetyltransferase [Roseovarius litoreus]
MKSLEKTEDSLSMEPTIVWGTGSQARIYTQELLSRGYTNITLVDLVSQTVPEWASCFPIMRDRDELADLLATKSRFIVAIGGLHGAVRTHLLNDLRLRGHTPLNLIDASANLKQTVEPGSMLVALQGVQVNHFVRLGDGVILNTGCTVDHECIIADGVHIMGGAAIAGRVSIGRFASIGTNATVLPDISIGEGAVIGAGAVVTRDVADFTVVAGVPARFIREAERPVTPDATPSG